MFKHNIGWEINARILRLCTDWHPSFTRTYAIQHCERIVREEIAQDRGLVWC